MQLVNASIKSLEKRNLIKSLKSVKNPTKKLYILSELEPSVELTGGSWYTDQEFDLEFIEALSKQCYKFIYAKVNQPQKIYSLKSFPVKNKQSIYPSTYEQYPTSKDVLQFIQKTGITNVDLSAKDVKQLLERLVYDGTVYKRMKVQYTHSFDDQAYSNVKPKSRMKQIRDMDSDDDVEVIGTIENEVDDDEGMRVVGDFEEDDVYMYVACGVSDTEKNGFGDVPCGKCPVFSFCSVDGPVNPRNCEYMNKWLAF